MFCNRACIFFPFFTFSFFSSARGNTNHYYSIFVIRLRSLMANNKDNSYKLCIFCYPEKVSLHIYISSNCVQDLLILIYFVPVFLACTYGF